MELYEKLKSERILRKITQDTMAKTLGVSRTTICAWESGKRVPPIQYLREYCKVFGFAPDFFENKQKQLSSNLGVSFDLSRLNYKGIAKLEEEYFKLLKNDDYIKKP